jgi:hypothetical protein
MWGAVIFWEADVRERNGKRQEAANIRGRVANLLSEQSKFVRCDHVASRNVHVHYSIM